MTFNFLPLPIYIALFLFLFFFMIFNAITRRKKDRIGLIVFYITTALLVPFMILAKLNVGLRSVSEAILAFLFLTIFVELSIMVIKDVKCGKGNKQAVIGLMLGWIIIIFFSLIMLNII